ncbi:MAG: DNA-binding protein [Chloroflexi bacterium]|nr:DNA-binding protein [Chloroflexota bacterium]
MAFHLAARMPEIIVARLEPDEDLFKGIQQVCRERNIRTGLVLSITGALERARLQRFPATYASAAEIPHSHVVEIEGPLEASGHGIIGEVRAPEFGDKPFGTGQYVHGDVYMHVHIVVTSAEETICGHLMEGCRVWSKHPISHFTIALAPLEGIALTLAMDMEAHEAGRSGIHHELAAI